MSNHPESGNSRSAIDAVDLSIMWGRLVSIADEIVSTLIRTSFSTIVSESYDLTVAIMDSNGQLLAQGTYSVPVFMGTAPHTLRHFLQRFPPETLKPGDVVISNDPWIGTGHMFDINVMRPVFRDGKIIAYTLSITHLPDIGGLGFGATATEVYHEGLRLPICKLLEGGVRNDFIVDLVSTNVRTPEEVLGDLFANVTCNEVGGRMLLDFMDEYGLSDLEGLSAAIRSHSEQATREAIGAMCDGTYQNSIQIEGIDGPLTLACEATISGDSISVDFAGTSPSVRRGINVPFCYTKAMSLYTVKCMTVPELPNNSGSVAPVHVVAPARCLLNAESPSPTGGRHVIGHFVTPLLFGALVEAAPDQVQADCGMMDLMTFQGTHSNGRGITTIYFASGGFGALQDYDGLATTPGPSNMAVVSTELWETLTGTTVEHRRLLPDSGGPGKARGGVGQEVTIRNDTGHPMSIFSMASRTEFPAIGLLGGNPGRPREHCVNGETIHPKGHYELAPGDRITLIEAGGGGFGDPSQRPRALLTNDLRHGYITKAGALRDYGVDFDAAEPAP
jgi:N-methylhydantoinase B